MHLFPQPAAVDPLDQFSLCCWTDYIPARAAPAFSLHRRRRNHTTSPTSIMTNVHSLLFNFLWLYTTQQRRFLALNFPNLGGSLWIFNKCYFPTVCLQRWLASPVRPVQRLNVRPWRQSCEIHVNAKLDLDTGQGDWLQYSANQTWIASKKVILAFTTASCANVQVHESTQKLYKLRKCVEEVTLKM